jgi:predicted aconitase
VEIVLTNSAKWAYYAPGNLGLDVVFDSLAACVETAVAGRRTGAGDVWS